MKCNWRGMLIGIVLAAGLALAGCRSDSSAAKAQVRSGPGGAKVMTLPAAGATGPQDTFVHNH